MKNNRTQPQTNDAIAETRAQKELLTPEEEKNLSIRVLKGKMASELLQNATVLTEEEKAEAQRDVKDGKEAQNILYERNLGLVYKFAQEQFKHNCGAVREYDDFLQEGRERLYIAAGTYDWKSGCLFCTYASSCIKNGYFRNNAMLGGAIRIPEGQLQKFGQYKKLLQEHSADEAAAKMEIPIETAILYEHLLPGRSLQDQVSQDDENCEFGELIADPDALYGKDLDDIIDAQARRHQVHAALAQLPADQARILNLHFGLETGEPRTLAQIAAIIGGSPSSIQKKEKSALKTLKKFFDNGFDDLPLAV